MKPYAEAILYLKTIITLIEPMETKDENYVDTNIGILNDIKATIDKLIANLQKGKQ